MYNFGILHGSRKFKVVVSFVEMNRWEDLSRWKNWKSFKGERGVIDSSWKFYHFCDSWYRYVSLLLIRTSPFNESFELIFFVSFPSFTLFEFSSVIVKMRIWILIVKIYSQTELNSGGFLGVHGEERYRNRCGLIVDTRYMNFVERGNVVRCRSFVETWTFVKF